MGESTTPPQCADIWVPRRISVHVLPTSSRAYRLELESTYLFDWLEQETSKTRVVLCDCGTGILDYLKRGAELRGLTRCDFINEAYVPYMKKLCPVDTYVFFKTPPAVFYRRFFNTVMTQFDTSETTRMVFMGDLEGSVKTMKELDELFRHRRLREDYQCTLLARRCDT